MNGGGKSDYSVWNGDDLSVAPLHWKKTIWKKTFANLEREKTFHGLQQMEALESLQAPAAANWLWPVGKVSPVL